MTLKAADKDCVKLVIAVMLASFQWFAQVNERNIP